MMAVMAEASNQEYNKYIVMLDWVHILFYFIHVERSAVIDIIYCNCLQIFFKFNFPVFW